MYKVIICKVVSLLIFSFCEGQVKPLKIYYKKEPIIGYLDTINFKALKDSFMLRNAEREPEDSLTEEQIFMLIERIKRMREEDKQQEKEFEFYCYRVDSFVFKITNYYNTKIEFMNERYNLKSLAYFKVTNDLYSGSTIKKDTIEYIVV